MILYLHLPGFYAAVEQADHPEHRGRPLLVGGNPRKGGSVTSASPEARERGVAEGTDLSEALARCPDAVVVPTRLARYREAAAEVRAIARAVTDRVETDGLVGLYLEVPQRTDPVSLAAELLVRIRAGVGVGALAGIGATRFVAQKAALHAGPARIRQVPPGEERRFLADLPVREIWGLGPANEARLLEHGMTSVGDLQDVALERLREIVGRPAETFRALARGEDRDPIAPTRGARSLSQERTLEEPSADLRTLGRELEALAGHLEAKLRREHRAARTVSLAVRYLDGHGVTRTQSLADAVESRGELAQIALDLMARTQAGARLVRRLRLQVTNLCLPAPDEDPRQLRLF